MKYLLSLVMALMFFVACENNDKKNVETEITFDKTEWNKLSNELETMGDKIDARIREIREDMADASEEAKAEMNEEINELQAWSNNIKQRLAVEQDKLANDWDQFKADVAKEMDEIKNGFAEMVDDVEDELEE